MDRQKKRPVRGPALPKNNRIQTRTNNITTADEIASFLDGAKRSGGGWIARCPVPGHEDKHPSFSVKDGYNGRPVVHCFVCSQDDVINTLREMGLWGGVADPIDLDAARARAQEKRIKEDAECKAAESKAREFVHKALPADPTHPYLRKKHIRPWGISQVGNLLVIPAYDSSYTVRTYQTINPNGEKYFPGKARAKGTHYLINGNRDKLIICEGFATGATIRQEYGHAVAVAFGCWNLKSIAQSLKLKFPSQTFIIAADDDEAGIYRAKEAAQEIGCKIVKPAWSKIKDRRESDIDFNDFYARLREAKNG